MIRLILYSLLFLKAATTVTTSVVQYDKSFNCAQLPAGTFSTLGDIFRTFEETGIDWRNFTRFYCSGYDTDLLTGSIPREVYDMTSLTTLYLPRNELTGTISPEIGRLSNLISLIWSGNKLTGTIPLEVASLTSLYALSINDNQLTGTLSQELFRGLTGLGDIDLRGNALTGTIAEDTFLYNEDLNLLSINNNPFSGAMPEGLQASYTYPQKGQPFDMQLWCERDEPRTLEEQFESTVADRKRLSMATQIHCISKEIIGHIPSYYGDISTLTSLYLESNQMEGTIPSELGRLTALTNLYLSSNGLTGTVPSTLSNLEALKSLRLEENNLTGTFPDIFSSLTNLNELYVAENSFEGTMPYFNIIDSDIAPGHNFDARIPWDSSIGPGVLILVLVATIILMTALLLRT